MVLKLVGVILRGGGLGPVWCKVLRGGGLGPVWWWV